MMRYFIGIIQSITGECTDLYDLASNTPLHGHFVREMVKCAIMHVITTRFSDVEISPPRKIVKQTNKQTKVLQYQLKHSPDDFNL